MMQGTIIQVPVPWLILIIAEFGLRIKCFFLITLSPTKTSTIKRMHDVNIKSFWTNI